MLQSIHNLFILRNGKTDVLNKLREIIDNANTPVYIDDEDEEYEDEANDE